MPRDPWNNEYIYLNEGGKPVIISYGADGTSGGEAATWTSPPRTRRRASSHPPGPRSRHGRAPRHLPEPRRCRSAPRGWAASWSPWSCVLATALAFGIALADRRTGTLRPQAAPGARADPAPGERLQGVPPHHGALPARRRRASASLINAKVLDGVPVDPWGHPYVYRYNNEHSGVVSYGADGVPGGEGENADITSGGLWRPGNEHLESSRAGAGPSAASR